MHHYELSDNTSVLYHGSLHNIKILDPKPTKVLEGEDAVFATDSKALAVIFIPKWNDCDIDLGYHNNILYCLEQYPDAFNLFKNISGYVHVVSSKQFMSDDRLGMKHHEFISKKKVPVISVEKIDNVYEYLIRSDICMITYEQKINALEQIGLIKNK